MIVKCKHAVLCFHRWFALYIINNTVLLVQSYTAFDLYAVSIAHGGLYLRQFTSEHAMVLFAAAAAAVS